MSAKEKRKIEKKILAKISKKKLPETVKHNLPHIIWREI